ncbi:hypothetical protein LLH03_04170 [bacterium]|nr:hypothetical protein [bacterium]
MRRGYVVFLSVIAAVTFSLLLTGCPKPPPPANAPTGVEQPSAEPSAEPGAPAAVENEVPPMENTEALAPSAEKPAAEGAKAPAKGAKGEAKIPAKPDKP